MDNNEFEEPDDCEPSPDAIEMMKQQLALAVKKGAYLLDEQNPGWRQRIDLERLNLSSGYSCVLGQVYHGYHVGVAVLGGNQPGWAGEHGFDFPDIPEVKHMSTVVVWEALDQLWANQIVEY